MKKLFIIAAVCVALGAAACRAQKQADVSVKVSAQDVYEGVLPAGDGPGIKTTLTLGPGNSFVQVSEYIGEPDGVFRDTGRFTQEGEIITLQMEDGPAYYLLMDDYVVRLGPDQQPVTGELAPYYVLEKK